MLYFRRGVAPRSAETSQKPPPDVVTDLATLEPDPPDVAKADPPGPDPLVDKVAPTAITLSNAQAEQIGSINTFIFTICLLPILTYLIVSHKKQGRLK